MIDSVTRLTGISQAMLRTEQPLSVAPPQFLDWVDTVVAEVSDATCTTHIPGMTTVTLYLVPFVYWVHKYCSSSSPQRIPVQLSHASVRS